MSGRTEYVGQARVADGYFGATEVLYLCRETSGEVLGVTVFGWFTYEDASKGIRPLPEASHA
jgi:hypothetical protein